jgi:RsiW-degrading membrane proteinase PrsW (M82 family)
MFLVLLFVAVAPGLFLLWYFYHRDKYEREPKKLLFKVFFFGCLTVIPAIIFELILEKIFNAFTAGVINVFLVCFIVVSPVEEILKYFVVRNWAYNRPEFDEIMDGIVYAVSASLGFATLENIIYVLSNGLGVGLIRAFLAVPGHAMYGAIMGYFLGRAKLNCLRSSRLILTGLLLAILFHGLYDFLLLTKTVLAVLVIALLVVLAIVIRKQLKRAEIQSRERLAAETMAAGCPPPNPENRELEKR